MKEIVGSETSSESSIESDVEYVSAVSPNEAFWREQTTRLAEIKKVQATDLQQQQKQPNDDSIQIDDSSRPGITRQRSLSDSTHNRANEPTPSSRKIGPMKLKLSRRSNSPRNIDSPSSSKASITTYDGDKLKKTNSDGSKKQFVSSSPHKFISSTVTEVKGYVRSMSSNPDKNENRESSKPLLFVKNEIEEL